MNDQQSVPHAPHASQSQPALVLRGVHKNFGDRCAVRDVSFAVQRGEILALLGPNGAGKTTTIEMCEGFLSPSQGSITALGVDPSKHPVEARRRMGIMLQGGGAYPGVKVSEMLHLVASYSSDPLDPEWLLDVVGLRNHRSTPYRRLSGGQQQRLSLACALVGRPELIFLDEPTAGLDAQSRLAVWDLVRALSRDGMTVLLTTHLMDEAEALADRVVILNEGQVVAEGSTKDLSAMTHDSVQLVVETYDAIDVADWSRRIGTELIEDRPHVYRAQATANPELIAQVALCARDNDVTLRSMSTSHQRLEDIFLDLTGREIQHTEPNTLESPTPDATTRKH